MMLRSHQADDPTSPEQGRLNLLLSYGGWRQTPAVEQLDRLLQPMGISSFHADCGEEAADIIRRIAIHIAVVDLAIPLDRRGPSSAPGGRRILEILRRLETPPPTVIVRPAPLAARESARGLSEALRGGAFAVLDRPVQLESMLEVMRRVLRRHYSGAWPGRMSSS